MTVRPIPRLICRLLHTTTLTACMLILAGHAALGQGSPHPTTLQLYTRPTPAGTSTLVHTQVLPDTSSTYIKQLISLLPPPAHGYPYTLDTLLPPLHTADTLVAWIYSAPHLTLHSLRIVPDTSLQYTLKLQRYTGLTINQSLLHRISHDVLIYYENHGYPFASLVLDTLTLGPYGADARIRVDKGNRIVIDSVITQGTTRLRQKFVERHIGYTRGMPYSEEYIKEIDIRWQQLEFVNLLAPTSIEFLTHTAKIYTALEPQKANRASALLAFGQNNEQKLEVLGEVFLDLKNIFGGGESLLMQWQKLEPQAQRLDIATRVPYALLGKIGVQAQVQLEKRDTGFFNLQARIGLDTHIGLYANTGIFASLLQGTTQDATGKATTRHLLYGAEYHWNNETAAQPRQYYKLGGEVSLGNRTSTTAEATHTSALGTAWGYIQSNIAIHQQWNLYTRAEGGFKKIFGNQNELLYLNELYTIGGVQSLRGFNERSIFASEYAILSAEPRLYYSRLNYLCVFYDWAGISRRTQPSMSHYMLHGLGVGASLDINTARLWVYYAIGSQWGQPLQFQSSKVHLIYKMVF